MVFNRALISSKKTGGDDGWCTPPEVLRLVRLVGPVGVDPCWNPGALTAPRCRCWLEDGQDGLLMDWAEAAGLGEVVFVNPPYSELAESWGAKIAHEGPRVRAVGAHLIALVPARTDTKWWQPMWDADALCFWRGRLRFLAAGSRKQGSTFPAAFIHWGPTPVAGRPTFSRVFSTRGRVIFPSRDARPDA